MKETSLGITYTEPRKCEHCKRKIMPHIYKDGARYHVVTYMGVNIDGKTIAVRQCDKSCEVNHEQCDNKQIRKILVASL